MASPEKIQSFLGFLATNYSSFDPRDDALVSYWTLMLKNLSEKQMETGVERMAHEHNSAWPPKPAMFNSWAGGREYVRKGSEYHFDMYTVVVGGVVKDRAKILSGPDPKFNSPIVRGVKAYNTRWKDVVRIWAGEIKLPITREQMQTVIDCPDPTNRDVLALRNRMRKHLGWPLLNLQGRPVPHA